jgi:hypothetical protein
MSCYSLQNFSLPLNIPHLIFDQSDCNALVTIYTNSEPPANFSPPLRVVQLTKLDFDPLLKVFWAKVPTLRPNICIKDEMDSIPALDFAMRSPNEAFKAEATRHN